jgi:hypothetical protein
MTNATGSSPLEFLRLELDAYLLARAVAVPAVEHHALEEDPRLPLSVRLDVDSQGAQIICGHRGEGGAKRMLL